MSNITLTKREHDALLRKSKTGWARYFSLLRDEQQHGIRLMEQIDVLRRQVVDNSATIPTHLKNEIVEMYQALGKHYDCCICMETPDADNIEISSCGHRYCKTCFNQLKETTKACAICRKKFY